MVNKALHNVGLPILWAIPNSSPETSLALPGLWMALFSASYFIFPTELSLSANTSLILVLYVDQRPYGQLADPSMSIICLYLDYNCLCNKKDVCLLEWREGPEPKPVSCISTKEASSRHSQDTRWERRCNLKRGHNVHKSHGRNCANNALSSLKCLSLAKPNATVYMYAHVTHKHVGTRNKVYA